MKNWWKNFWGNPTLGWSRGHKVLTYIIIAFLALVVLALIFWVPWGVERQVGSTVTVTETITATLTPPTTTKTVTATVSPALTTVTATLPQAITTVTATLSLAPTTVTVTTPATVTTPGPMPKSWTSFTGEQAMNLALTTFGNIRIKVFFSEGSVPLLSEAATLIVQKPKDLTLLAWIGNTTGQAKNWPIGLASPNAGDWPTEVFLAKDTDGTVKYFYIVPLTSNVVVVDRAWVATNNLYWLFLETPAYRK